MNGAIYTRHTYSYIHGTHIYTLIWNLIHILLYKDQGTNTGKKQFVDIIPPFKVIDENVQHYYGQKNVQSLAEIVLDVFTYNFKRRNDINKLFFSSER